MELRSRNLIWKEVVERFGQQALGAVMAHQALDRALPVSTRSSWAAEPAGAGNCGSSTAAGSYLQASEKRLAPLRGFRGAALPGHALVIYDADSALVCDIVACEDAYESKRPGPAPCEGPRQAGVSATGTSAPRPSFKD